MDHGEILFHGSVREFIDYSSDHEQSSSNVVVENAQMPKQSLFDALSLLIDFDLNKIVHARHSGRGTRRGGGYRNRRRGGR